MKRSRIASLVSVTVSIAPHAGPSLACDSILAHLATNRQRVENRRMAGPRGAVFRDALEVFAKGDNEAWRDVVPKLFDPEVEWRPALATHVYHGHDGAVRWLEVMTSGFADFRAEAEVTEEHGDRFLTLHRFHGVHVNSGV